MNLSRFFINKAARTMVMRAVPYGTAKKDGSHDHRYNKGADRTPAQKQGDIKREKSGD